MVWEKKENEQTIAGCLVSYLLFDLSGLYLSLPLRVRTESLNAFSVLFLSRIATALIVESARSIPYEEHKFARNYVISAHYIALIRAI
jgi:hypothetical protein